MWGEHRSRSASGHTHPACEAVATRRNLRKEEDATQRPEHIELRGIQPDDEPFLWRMLTHAASMESEDVEAAVRDPLLRDYVEGFGRAKDFGLVALQDGQPVGAAWLRCAPRGVPVSPSKVWTTEIPELAIAVIPGLRGRSVGSRLLRELIERSSGSYPALALSVREGSPAVRLYERWGFETERVMTNRVGTRSLMMVRRL